MQPTQQITPGQPLSPQQVQQFRSSIGVTSPAQTAQSVGQPDPWAQFDAEVNNKPAETQQSNPINDYLSNAGNATIETANNYLGENGVGAAAQDVMGGGNIGTAVSDFGKGDIAGGLEAGGLGTAADAAKAIFAPLTAPLQTLLTHTASYNAANKNNNPITAAENAQINSPEAQQARQQIADWSKLNPEMAKTLGDAFTVGSSVIGGEGLNADVGDIAQGVKNSVTNTASKIKDAVTPNPAETEVASTAKTTAQSAKNLQTSIQNTMPLTDKNTRITSLRNTLPDSASGKGGVTRQGVLGKSTIQPTQADIARGTVAHEYINGVKDPIDRIAKVNQGIKDTSTATDSFLDHNSSPANFEDMRDYVEANNKPSEGIQKDPGANEAYQRSTNNALNTLYNTMKATAKETGDFGAVTPGTDIRAARQAIDKQIIKELGEETFGTPQYKGIKAAEVNVRNVMNRMGEDMLRYPGQLDKLNAFNADKGALTERGIEVTPEAEEALKDQHGLTSTPESEANAQQLANQHDKMSKLYESLDNMINKQESSVGKEKWQEYLKDNPKIRKVIRYGLITGGVGLLGHEL